MSSVYFRLSSGNLSQNWTNTSLLTTSTASVSPSASVWDLIPSIIGFRGDGLAATGSNPQLVTGTSTVPNLIANQTNPNTLTSGGVAEFELADPTIALQGSGTARAPYLAIYLDATDRQDVTLTFNARDIDGSGDNAAQQIAVQYRIGDTGAWIDLPAGYIADASSGPNLATLVTPVIVNLPASVNGQAQVQVRIITTDAAGSDEWIGIDDIVVTSNAASGPVTQPGALAVNDVIVDEGNSGTTDVTFTVTRSGGDDGAVGATWTLANGTANAADFAPGQPLTGTVTFADGQTSATVTIQIAGDTAFELNETFNLVLSAPTGGASLADNSGLGTIANDDAPPPVQNVWINEFHYDPSSDPETGEFIEIAGQAGIDLTGYRIYFYNGSNGGTYVPAGSSTNNVALGGVLADSANGFGFASVLTPGLQNGAPDGFALVDPYGRVVQFLSYEGTMTATNGPAAGMTSTDIGRFESQATPGTSLQLTGTGSTYADFSWTFGNANTSGGTNVGQSFLSGSDQGQIRIDNASVIEGNGGSSLLVFTLHRSGGFDSSASVDYSVVLDTADAADLVAGTPLSGSVTFAAGQFTQTITIPVAGDTAAEYNEALSVVLGTVSGNAVVVDGQAVGTILNDDPIALSIMQIQGEGHVSEFVGQPVITSGIVTAIAGNGFYLQDANGDGNARTSDAVFVFTSTPPTVLVGDAVNVTGRVVEFGSGLPLTEINVTGGGAFGVTVTSSGNALPAAVLVGTGGLTPPTESIDSDGLTLFNPDVDGADFWESLEGMRVELDRPQVVAESNTALGETYVVASRGEGASGLNDSGGLTISPGDYNPEMIQIDDTLIGGRGYVANHSVGDQFGNLIGIVNYSFEHYELLLTEVPEGTVDVTLQPETVVFQGDANYMTVATLNVENLDPSDGKYDEIADQIVHNLRLPDVIAVQEMQDNDGAANGSDLSATQNAQNLIDAIYAESGVLYEYVEIAPTAPNISGGEPNGNIRVGYFYRVDRVDLVEGSVQVINDDSFANSRLPLVATWSFQGTEITTINVHFTARSGSDPLWGIDQPPENAGEDRRIAQADAVGDFIYDHLADDPSYNAVVLGDWNGFYFETAQTQLTGLVNLQATLLPEEDRYSYLFEGNAQLLDNIVVTGGLLPGADVDGVHVNAYFGAAQTSDHDPQVARFLIGSKPTDITMADSAVDENAPAGTVVGTVTATDAPGDVLTYSLVDNGGGRFAINAVTGVIVTTMALDHEALASTSVVVRVTDAAGQFTDQTILINIDNVNEAPVAANDVAGVDEDATSANLWAQLVGNDSDPDAGDTLTISAVDTTGTLGTVLFDPATQTLRYVADHDSFDKLAAGASVTDRFTYTVTDADGLTSTATVTMTVTGVADGIVVNGDAEANLLFGTAGEDKLYGNNGNDRLDGGAGHDLLDGGRGDDTLYGGIGNDLLVGGQGNDKMYGGSGSDTFAVGKLSGNDVVFDFDAFNDKIRLDDGVTVKSATVGDVNNDGIADLYISLFKGGSISLLGIDSLDGVQFESGAALARVAGWKDAPAMEVGASAMASHDYSALALPHDMNVAHLVNG